MTLRNIWTNVLLLFVFVTAVQCAESDPAGLEHFLIFDIIGDITYDDVMSAVDGRGVMYLFQAVGGQRYFVVFNKGQNRDLLSLKFPGASSVTPYLAERSDEFFAKYGAGKKNMELGVLEGDGLIVVEVDLLMTGLSLSEYQATMKRMGDELQKIHTVTAALGFHLLGPNPAKILSFDQNADTIVQRMIAIVRDPNLFTVKATPIIRIL